MCGHYAGFKLKVIDLFGDAEHWTREQYHAEKHPWMLYKA